MRLAAGSATDSKMEQDNQKLFALYSAVNTLAYLTKMAQNPKSTSGQLAGLNDRFQKGLAQSQLGKMRLAIVRPASCTKRRLLSVNIKIGRR